MVLLRLKDPFKLFVKRRELLPGSGFLSHSDMTRTVIEIIFPINRKKYYVN